MASDREPPDADEVRFQEEERARLVRVNEVAAEARARLLQISMRDRADVFEALGFCLHCGIDLRENGSAGYCMCMCDE